MAKRSPPPEFARALVRQLPPSVTYKWTDAVLDEGFVAVPKRLLRCCSQVFSGPNAIADLQVILAIADYIRPNLTRWPSYEYIAFMSGVEKHEVRACCQHLQEAGLISITEIGDPVQEVVVDLSGLLNEIVRLTDDESRTPTHKPSGHVPF